MRLRKITLLKYIWSAMVHHFPQTCARIYYFHMIKRLPHLYPPHDLNEKIQWLKFHEDMDVWARLADKCAVREYVKDRGLEHILVKLYGKFDSGEELVAAWNSFPGSFIIKSNNGCATNIIVKDKHNYNIDGLAAKLNDWLKIDYGTIPVELHYNRIVPCLIVEELLENPCPQISNSLIDYKIWCFNGKPYTILVAYDRDITTDAVVLTSYNLDWKETLENMTNKTPRKPLPKPTNLEEMLRVAAILSDGHPQMRVDLYNVNGKIYFGELTMSSMGGYMAYYTPEFLLEMGEQVKLPA